MLSKMKGFFTTGANRSKSPTNSGSGSAAASTGPKPKLAASYREKPPQRGTTHNMPGDETSNETPGVKVPLSQSANDVKLHEALERRDAAAAAACLGDGAQANSCVALPTDAEPTGMPALARAAQWRGGGACVELLLLRGAEPTVACPGDSAGACCGNHIRRRPERPFGTART